MPNKRNSSKSKVGIWLPNYERDLLRLLAEDAELNMTEMVQEMIHAYAQVRGIKINLPSEVEAVAKKRNKKTNKKTKGQQSK